MSADIYSRLLWWNRDKGHGLAKCGDVTLTLRRPPEVAGLALVDVDYGEIRLGETTYALVRPTASDRERDMENAELLAVKAWLDDLGKTASQFLARKS